LLSTNYDQQNVLRLAAKQDDTNILEEIWNRCKENLTQLHLNNTILLAKDMGKRTAWPFAADQKIEILQKL
jgi:hypothetical protein